VKLDLFGPSDECGRLIFGFPKSGAIDDAIRHLMDTVNQIAPLGQCEIP
jgi:hypothetical protein